MKAMTAEWMFYFFPLSIWFAVAASAGIAALIARRRDEERRQQKLRLAFARARSVRTQGFSSVERSDAWR
jgi:diacylglycerol kinase family enzyme